MQTAKHVIFAIPVAITVNDSVVSTACIEGGSMQPVLNPKGSTTRDRSSTSCRHARPDVLSCSQSSSRQVLHPHGKIQTRRRLPPQEP
eukprot:751042-Hanusia_phi.AAC.3